MSSEWSSRGPGKWAVVLASFTERYVLSLVYLYFTDYEWLWVRRDWPGVRANNPTYIGYFSNDGTLLALNLLMAIALLAGRRAKVAPRNVREFVVPLIVSFYFLLFSYIQNLPDSLQWLAWNRAPGGWVDTLNYASVVVGALGTLLSIWGLISLGRSFGIFVGVRTVILRGPYRYVRHPMYCGYIIMSVGLLLADANLALAILVPIQIALFAWRARLEEARLAEFSPDYRAYQARTGFFLPTLRVSSGTARRV